ncbi:MAG: signal peptidase I [Treponema sp.]|jgi:signal peptidase I|nr:signal peptidase I [Treponema sp.]
MANRWRRYSYVAQKNYLRRVRVILVWVLIFFVIHTVIAGLFFSNRTLESDAMRPGLLEGDRFVFLSFTLHHIIRDRFEGNLPFRRGQVVLVDRSAGSRRNPLHILLDAGVRFFTLQRISFFPREDTVFVKRVIGLPGDTLSVNNYVVRIKPAGETYEYVEFELTEKDYTPELPQVSPLWDRTIPFSGSMDSVTLKENECFVLSDDRGNTNDSRTWGPIPADSITGRALARYWPLTRLGPF